MAKEIERKFLVVSDDWRDCIAGSVEIRDGLVAVQDGRKIRIRMSDDKATLSIKGPKVGLVRDEFEFEIPESEGAALLSDHCGGVSLRKTRHFVSHRGEEWVVDEFHGVYDGILLAEIELDHEGAEFPRPSWLGREVTGEEEYRQSVLFMKCRRPSAQARACR